MQLKGKVEKTWGHESIFVTNDKYTGKFMMFKNPGDKTSMHFHKEKHETWYCMGGVFEIKMTDTTDGTVSSFTLLEGEVMTIEPLKPHQIIALQADSVILEISTPDSVEDNYRLYR
jgi:mannose-6-phosphate isomerase-like protein (cupin superfamily)